MNLNDQLALKLKLEGIFQREVRSLFNFITRQYRVGISTGNPVRAQKYAADWSAALEKQYRRTQRAFTGIVSTDEKGWADIYEIYRHSILSGGFESKLAEMQSLERQMDEKQDEERDDLLIAALMAWSLNSAQTTTKEIIDTTQNNMDTAMTQARQALSDDGNFQPSQREIAVAAAVILNRKFRGRTSTIVITNTQQAAESTKLIGAYGEAGLDPMAAVTRERIPIKPKAVKDWSDDGGPNVRDGHHTGQVAQVFIDDPFIVNGQQLMYPGDTSRGASIENIANCHCSATYTFN